MEISINLCFACSRVAKIYVGNLTHENIKMRKAAYHSLGCILRQQKRAHPKVEIK